MKFRSCGYHAWHGEAKITVDPVPMPEALTFERCGKRKEKIVEAQCGGLGRLYFCHYIYHFIWK